MEAALLDDGLLASLTFLHMTVSNGVVSRPPFEFSEFGDVLL